MAYAIIHHFAGGTQAQYEAVLAAVHPDGGLPPGQVYHLAGPAEDGWTVVAVHDSRASWEQFRDGTLLPTLSAGVDGGFTGLPQEMSFEVAAETSASSAQA
jgi:hypothetical protein